MADGVRLGIPLQLGCDERVNQDEKARLDFVMIVAISELCNACLTLGLRLIDAERQSTLSAALQLLSPCVSFCVAKAGTRPGPRLRSRAALRR